MTRLNKNTVTERPAMPVPALLRPCRARAPLMRMALALVATATLLASGASSARAADAVSATPLDTVLAQACTLAPLETVIVAREGQVLAERGCRKHRTTEPTNIKSASKLVMSALVGIAIDKGVLTGTEQRVAPLLASALPPDPDPRLQALTIGHLLSMQAGLGSTSGANYGAWVASRNWVRAALARPFEDEPGGRMIYSTGSTHLLSAILTRQSGRSSLQLARDWLGPLEGFEITSWTRDPQGIPLGGNEMAMSPRSLLAFGELYRRGGVNASGERLLSQAWIDASWQPRTQSPWTGDGHGYAWFLTRIAGEDVRYGWGYGGQMLYVVPRLGMSVVMTSDARSASARNGHRGDLHRLLGQIIASVDDAPPTRSTHRRP
ncbi:Beta-lactamase class C and other penicillin binding proteins [plant metagenome]|uniref:Beta-lactamase class C and other penicillin binding proteins n=1 Tax=plant metagenome TaxID=1297885 RepID=A0A484RQX2_9ZZZZ